MTCGGKRGLELPLPEAVQETGEGLEVRHKETSCPDFQTGSISYSHTARFCPHRMNQNLRRHLYFLKFLVMVYFS